MKPATYYKDGAKRSANMLEDERIADTRAVVERVGTRGDAYAGAVTNREFVALGQDATRSLEARAHDDIEALASDGAVHDPEVVRLGPPIVDPQKIICLGLNYRDHAEESGLTQPDVPMFFATFPNSLVGPTDEIVHPRAGEKVDYEAELAVVITGRVGHE